MNKQYIFSALTLTAVIASGCTKDPATPNDRNSTAIELMSVCTVPMTKAVINGTSFTSEEADAGIGMFLLDRDGNIYDGNKENVRYEFNDGKWTADSPLRVGGATGFLYGYYPYSGTVKDITKIPVESSVNGADYLYSSKEEVTSSNAGNVSLSLNHALARVSLSFKLDESYVGNGVLNSISLSGDCVAVSGTLDATDGGISAARGEFSATGLSQTIVKDASTTIECIVVPATKESGTPELRVACTIDGKAYATTLTGDIAALAGGKQTSIDLTLLNASIKVDRSVIGKWDAGESQEISVGEHTLKIVYSSDTGIKDDVWVKKVEVIDNLVKVTAQSVSGRHLKCTLADGNTYAGQIKTDNLIYTFTISDISGNTTATIGYANAVSIAATPANAGTVKIDGDLYEGETVRLVPAPAYEYGISCWKDQNDEILCDGYDYTVLLSSKVSSITAVFKENLVLDGVFTVNDTGKKVRFTRGNLYYDGSSKIEQRQYDFNSKDYTSSTGHVSHFMWSKSLAEATKKAYSESRPGVNDIFFTNQSGFTVKGFHPSDCFALSDWYYLLNGRTGISTVNGTENARFVMCNIRDEGGNLMYGMFIFPDVFTWPESVSGQPSGINEAQTIYANTYSYNDFKRLQDAGIVFLPTTGHRIGNGSTSIVNAGKTGYYWSSAPVSTNASYAYYLSFPGSTTQPSDYFYRRYAFAVRLVTEVKE